jgi:hypothetical protein
MNPIDRSAPERPSLRLADVLAQTGWNYAYVRKLVDAQVLRVVKHDGHRCWYFPSDVQRAMTPRQQ